ncbi:MAG TPA: phage tail protein [Gemmatimonadales bacterium]
MGFFLVFFFWVAATILGELLRPKPKFGSPQPSSLGDFSLPTAQEGRAIPVLWGTCKVKGPNVVWYGDLLAVPVTKKVKTGLFSSKRITTGYRYHLGLQAAICHGVIDEFLDLRFDDRSVAPRVERVSRPSSVTNEFTTPWRGQDGGGPSGLEDYVNEPNPLFSTYITQGSVARGGAVSLGMTSVTPAPGATVKIRLYVRRTQGVGGSMYFVFALTGGMGSTAIIERHDLSTIFWTLVEYTLTPSEVASLNFSALVLYLSSAGGTAPLQDYFSVAFAEVECSSALADAPAAFNAAGLMQLDVDSPALFGGPDAEGGVVGQFDLYAGTTSQLANDYLEGAIGADLPGYRGLCYLVSRRAYLGTTPYLKPMSVIVRRCPNQLGLDDDHENIAGDANPACVLYEILTDLRWGLMMPSSKIDAASFVAAGDTLFDEGLGISMVVDSQTTGFDLVGEILRHVDGVIYPDPQTGKLTLILAREDYSAGSLPILDDSSIETCKISRPSWAETRNSVKVRYVDRSANFTERIAAAQDLANVQARGGEVAEEQFDFLGLSNATQAQKAVARVLKTASYPLAGVELVVNRIAYAYRPGTVFKLTWPAQGIVGMICRVTRVSTGDLLDGRVRIDAVEDIFAVAWTAYTPPVPSSGWVDPVGPPAQLLAGRLVELPYALVIGEDRLVMTLGSRDPAVVTLGYEVRSDTAGGIDYLLTEDVKAVTPSGLLVDELDYNVTFLTIANGPDVATLRSAESPAEYAAGVNVLLVDDEFMTWASISDNGDGTFLIDGLVRGALDTTPKPHAADARVWFTSAGAGLAATDPYPADLTLTAILLAYNPNGIVDAADATALTVTTDSRAQRPYVPRDVRLNDELYPLDIDGELTISWTHRDRLGDWDYDDGGATAALEAGSTYTLKLYDETGTLQRTETGLTGTSYTWSDEIADCGLGRLNDVLRVVLSTVGDDALESFQVYDYTVSRGGYGLGGFGFGFGEGI